MDHAHWFYKKDDENEIYIDIENFLSTWWVKDILTQTSCCCTNGNEKSESWIQHCVLPANVILFLKWLFQEMSRLDPRGKKKVVIEIINKLHLDYVAAMTSELQRIMREGLIEPELKKALLTEETFLPNKTWWPSRWYIHIRWNLKQIPNNFWNLVHVELVDFKNKWNEKDKGLKTIPYQIGRFEDLKYLTCCRNALKSLPSSLQFCRNLERLDISINHLEELPLFLLDMPKLELIYRSENRLSFYITSYDLQFSKMIEEDITVEETKEVEKLATIAGKSICKQRLYSPEELQEFKIPKHLKFGLQYLSKSWNYCYACKKGIAKNEEGYKFWFTMDGFVGNTSIPTFCYACSSCKENVERLMLKITQNSNSTGPLLYKNPDVSIRKLHEKNCSCCRTRNFFSKFLKKF